jgi:hypothetical protein
MERFIKLILLIALLHLTSCTKAKQITVNNCWPTPNISLPQFIVGYGSLMEEQSKRKESTQVGENYPIYLSGFRRAWIEPGITHRGFGITFLGIRQDAKAKINAVYYKLNKPEAIYNYDKRENIYCRLKVSPKQIKTLSPKKLPFGEYWIYLTKASQVHRPSSQKPIFQSYVDLFLSGCFELEKKFHLKNFAKSCVKTTGDWSVPWINDRSNPRTGFGNTQYSVKIDHLLATELPLYFKQIQLENANNTHLVK